MPRTSASSCSQTAAEYYSSFSNRPGLAQKFNNIDEDVHFRDYQKHLQDAATQNFVLDFGNDDAWCAVNLDEEDFAALLDTPVFFSFFIFSCNVCVCIDNRLIGISSRNRNASEPGGCRSVIYILSTHLLTDEVISGRPRNRRIPYGLVSSADVLLALC